MPPSVCQGKHRNIKTISNKLKSGISQSTELTYDLFYSYDTSLHDDMLFLIWTSPLSNASISLDRDLVLLIHFG